VLRLVIASGMRPVAAGLVVGVAGIFALTRQVASLLFGVTATDPATLAGVTLLFCGVSLAALYLPARRAARIDALGVMRSD